MYLERDVSETDRFDRLLRYVWLEDGTMVNATLVAEGYAQVSTYPPDVKYVERFLAAQSAARESNWGAAVKAKPYYRFVGRHPELPEDCGSNGHRHSWHVRQIGRRYTAVCYGVSYNEDGQAEVCRLGFLEFGEMTGFLAGRPSNGHSESKWSALLALDRAGTSQSWGDWFVRSGLTRGQFGGVCQRLLRSGHVARSPTREPLIVQGIGFSYSLTTRGVAAVWLKFGESYVYNLQRGEESTWDKER